ncbi:MAG: LPS assembly protein LptD [Phycisphaerales bacterium]
MECKRSIPTRTLSALCSAIVVFGAVLTPHLRAEEGDTNRVHQPTPPPASRVLLAQGLPIEPLQVDARFSALRAHVWREARYVDRLYLEGWVEVSIGDYEFSAERAVVWINREPSPEFGALNEIVILFEDLTDASRRSGMSAEADELLVTASTTGSIALRSDLFVESPPTDERLLDLAEARVVRQLTQPRADARSARPVIDYPPPPGRGPAIEFDEQSGEVRLADRGATEPIGPWDPVDLEPGISRMPEPPEAVVLFDVDGDLKYFFADESEEEGLAVLRGRLVVQYQELSRRPGEAEPRVLTLTAQRAVIFTDPITVEEALSGRVEADAVRGVYLEGNVVASDGQYTLRGPRMYYEFDTNKAVVIDAVLSTYSSEAKVPIYMRADEIRQIADNEWRAERMTISTSEFYVPHVSVGAGSVTVERRVDPDSGITKTYVEADNITARLGGTPILWWPGYKGQPEDAPLRSLSIGNSDNKGVTLRTEWNLFSLLDREPPDDVDASLLVDYYGERGPATGVDVAYETDRGEGNAFGYIIQDDGTDLFSSGRERNVDDETRGVFEAWHIERLPDDWTILFEAAYISDPGFIENFFENDAEERREYQTRLYAKQQRDNWAFEAFVKYDLNDFIANEDLLQSVGYQVDKFPELGYYRFADDLGRLSWSSEYRYTRARTVFPRHTLAEIGQGRVGFGLPPGTNLTDAALAAGFRENWVNRLHTRQELSLPLTLGAWKVVPFAVGRLTSYDDEFEEFSAQAEENRWYLAGGVRLATQLSGVNNAVENRVLDLHRIRHIIEPSLTLWHGESNAGANAYPIYDYEVEGVTEGGAARFGLRNIWQTQRGGPGRWRSVDFLRVDTDVVMSTSENQGDFVLPRFYDYRPEYSRLGDHILVDGEWLVSDSLALAGRSIYDLNESAIAHGSFGYRIDHSADLFSFVDYRYFDAVDDRLLLIGLGYRLTPKYAFRGIVNYDLKEDEARSMGLTLDRKTPQFDVSIGASYNQFREETTVSLTLSPKGSAGRTYGGPLEAPDGRK